MKNPTKAQAVEVLNALLVQQGVHLEGNDLGGPTLMEDFDGRKWTILWEEGPYEWPYLFPEGGVEEEFGFRVADVSEKIPAGLLIEPINHYSVGIYKD